LRDKSLELFERVSLRQIKDFAKELNVNTAQGQMLFWRYYLVSEEEAIEFLKSQYNKPAAKKEEAPKEIVQEKPVEDDFLGRVEEEIEKKEVVEEKVVEQPKPTPKPVSKPTPKLVVKEASQQQLSIESEFDQTEFSSLVTAYFTEANITIKESEQLSKNREYEYIVTVPSAVGTMDMYVRARNKKKLNEGDVAPALLRAKTKDLPCLFLTNGEFTKKSLALINKEYKGIIIKQL
jgi:hypothetical protein